MNVFNLTPYLLCCLVAAGERCFAADNRIAQVPASQGNKGFLENKGQMLGTDGNAVPFVLFKTDDPGINIYITKKGLTYSFLKFNTEGKENKTEETKEGKYEWRRMDVELAGANIQRENIVKENPSRAGFHYYLGHCPDGIREVKEYEKITIKEVYQGIDWVIYRAAGHAALPDDPEENRNNGLKYDFIVHPGADPSQIKLRYMGAARVTPVNNDQLQIKSDFGTLTEGKLYCYEKKSGKEISSRYHLENSFAPVSGDRDGDPVSPNPYPCTEITFQFASDISFLTSDMVIDPALAWATFYGGSNDAEGPYASVADASGNLFVTGYAVSTDFPVLNAGVFYQGTNAGPATTADVFILKFDNSGVLLWATYYGGSSVDRGFSITMDGNDNVFVTGTTASANFPVQNAGTYYQGVNAGSGYDAFILKFDNAGIRQWATYYGGGSGAFPSEEGYAIATDGSGNLFVAGATGAANFPVVNAFQPAMTGGTRDAFISKFDNAGNCLWATYYGGGFVDMINSIATDGSGNVFATGRTNSGDFPVQNAGTFYQGAYAGSYDGVILKFDNAGTPLWSTYYGGSGADYPYSIATDNSGNAFVTGYTGSVNFPVQNAGTFYQGTKAGGTDAFILKFNNSGNRLWATYYGGSGGEEYDSYDNIGIDNCGNLYIGFLTPSPDLPVQTSCDAGGYQDNTYNGSTGDIAIVSFDNTGNCLWSTYLGGDGYDFRQGIAMDKNNNMFMVGEWTVVTSSAGYPVANPGGGAYYDGTFNGGIDDGYVVKFQGASCLCSTVLNVSIAAQNISCNGQCTGTGTATPAGGTGPYTYSWNTSPVQTTQTATGLCAGGYTVTVTDAAAGTASDTITIIQPPALGTTGYTSTPDVCGSGNGSVTTNNAGGILPYSYNWNPSGQTTQTATGLAAGNYLATVTDANGCTIAVLVPVVSSGSITAAASSSTICAGQTATLAASGGTNYSWSNGNTGSTVVVSPAVNTTYSVIVSMGSCADTASATVSVNPSPSVAVTGNTTLCAGDIATLTASGGTNYSWSNGNTTAAIYVSPGATATYTVTASNGSCASAASITVVVSPSPVPVATSASICSGQTATLTASGGGNYLWSNGATTSSITAVAAAAYSVIVSIGTCSDTASASVTVNPNPTAAAASNTTITQGQTATLSASGGGTYLWSNNSTSNPVTVSPSATTVYCVAVTNAANCSDTACVTVTVKIEPLIPCGDVFVPTAFSPGNDGNNELECVLGNCIEVLSFAIYGRWGEKIFESNDQKICWDGLYKGRMLNTSVFVYYLKATLTNGEVINKKGNISLIR